MVYTQRAPRRQQSNVAPAHVTNCDKQRRCKYTISVNIQKRAMKGIQSIVGRFRITWDKSAVRMLENREKSYIKAISPSESIILC